MDIFTKPTFGKAILGIAQAYGDPGFWFENLAPHMNPDATWRALLVVGALKDIRLADRIRKLLVSSDSRVRAWACFALGQMKDESSVNQIYAMNADPSNRVRVHAWQAVQAIVGPEESARHFPIHIPTWESLILISEDSKTMQATLSDLLREMRFKVRVASSEQETIDLALKLKPQAIITDNQKEADNLSGLNMTWDLCRRPELRETIIFMLTADFIEPIFLWSGGDCFLSKQESKLNDLAAVILEYLHH
jgi:CheY-like chemotaxis protein